MRWRTRERRHRTDRRGVYRVVAADGSERFVATWQEMRPSVITDPTSTLSRTDMERYADTFEEACRLRDEGMAAQRRGPKPPSAAQRMAEQVMAGKWFEYWVRR